MIHRSDFESISESASSLDYNPRGYLQGSVFAGGGDPYLRIGKDTEKEIIQTSDELKEKIDGWREHVKNYATGAGFRKASRGQVDPRKFALQLSRIAFRHAQQHGSKSLLKLSKGLKWASSQSRRTAEEALNKISNETEDHDEFPGRARIEKPGIPTLEPQWGPQRGAPVVDPAETPVQPGSMRQKLPDQSWSAERTTGSRRRADSEKSNEDLVSYAREFLEDYRSDNSLADNKRLLDALDKSDVYRSWVKDLSKSGVIAEPGDLDDAWNQALSEMTSESPDDEEESLEDEAESLSGIKTSRRSSEEPGDPDDPDRPHIQKFLAPGGDWGNTVVRKEDSPLLSRYIDKRMNASKRDHNWAGRYLEDDSQSVMDHIARRAKSKKKKDDDDCECDDEDDEKGEEVMKAVDQCLDHFAGEMVPSEISPEHVKQFIEQDFPEVPWEEVYDAIEEIADPKKRHEKERTNEEYRDSRPAQMAHRRPRVSARHYVSAFDTIESAPRRKYARLHGHREICACCSGTGQEGSGACSRCQGCGQHGLDPDDPQIASKARVIDRVGSLLLVEVNPRQLAPKGRHLLSLVTNTRVASGSLRRYKHSMELMSFLTGYDVPYKVVGYTHPNYTNSKKRVAVTTGDIGVVDSLKLLQIAGTGDFDQDKKMMRQLILRLHPDQNPNDEPKRKAWTVLWEMYIKQGKKLPQKKKRPQQAPPQQDQPSQQQQAQPQQAPPRQEEQQQARPRQESSPTLSEGRFLAMINHGYQYAASVLERSGTWLAERKDCKAVAADLNSSGLYRNFLTVNHELNSKGNRDTYRVFRKFSEDFWALTDTISDLREACGSNKGYPTQFISKVKKACDDILKDRETFTNYYHDFRSKHSR